MIVVLKDVIKAEGSEKFIITLQYIASNAMARPSSFVN